MKAIQWADKHGLGVLIGEPVFFSFLSFSPRFFPLITLLLLVLFRSSCSEWQTEP